ncbi:MAG: FAD-dependent oxidoreductase [Chloroflexi bacterium]|nr:FAD-dependent oxidoreductase [Chloroflexota bacterium]
MYDIIIVGGGPAGLSAAVYVARKRLSALLISGDLGGQLNLTMDIENYLGYQFIEGPELISKFHEQVAQYPIDQKIGYRVARLDKIPGGFEATTEDGGETYQSRVVIFTAGKRPRPLNVPGESEFTGRGVSYCAICDGPLFAGKKVAVVGGGSSGVEAALDLVKIAEYTYLVELKQLSAEPILIEKLKASQNVTVFVEHQVEKIEGKDFVEALLVRDVRSGETKRLDVGGVFIEIGLIPNSEPVKGLAELNKWGEVVITPSCETSVPGLYAAGDVTNVPEKQIVVAAGEGAKAALQAHRYLQRLAA